MRATVQTFKDAEGRSRRMYMANDTGYPGAPLPLTRHEAIMRAADLNSLGFDWPAVALAMDYYHGWPLRSQSWKDSVRKWVGVKKAKPRGVSLGG